MKTTVSLVLLISLFVGCASNKAARHDVQEKVAHEQVSGGKEFATKIRTIIDSSKTLNADQKQKLHALLSEVGQKNKALFQESFKLRSVLVQELISGKANNKQVKILKKKIKKTESERLSNGFAAMDKVSAIVSNDPQRDRIMQELLQIDHIRD